MIIALCMIAIGAQATAMVIDEGWFHRARGLTRRERIGQPLDTLTIVVCLLWLIAVPPSAPFALPVYIALAVFAALYVARGAVIAAPACSPGEQRLHALLSALHPIALGAFAWLWSIGAVGLLFGQLGIAIAFLAYQVIYWNLGERDDDETAPFEGLWYAGAGARWYPAGAKPIAAGLIRQLDASGLDAVRGARDLCDGRRDGEAVLADEVRAGSVRDLGSRTG